MTAPAAHHSAVTGSCRSVSSGSTRSSSDGSLASSDPRMESTVIRMIWGVRALSAMDRHAHSSAAAKCPQQGRR